MKHTMMKLGNKWTFSLWDDMWENPEFDTKQEAIAEARFQHSDYSDQDYVYIGRTSTEKLGANVDVEAVLEMQGEFVFERVDDVSTDYLENVDDVHKAILERNLNKVFNEWMANFGYRPNFYEIVDVERVALRELNPNG